VKPVGRPGPSGRPFNAHLEDIASAAGLQALVIWEDRCRGAVRPEGGGLASGIAANQWVTLREGSGIVPSNSGLERRGSRAIHSCLAGCWFV
jgi:hypothetical protein